MHLVYIDIEGKFPKALSYAFSKPTALHTSKWQ